MPSLDYTVERNGQTDVMDDHHILTQFQQAGYPVQGVTADGMHLIGQDPPGPKGQAGQQYKIPIEGALKELGYTVHGAEPIDTDDTTVEPLLSGMVHQMPEDNNMRKAYIEHTLKSRGIDKPQVMGQGNNWHVYNPNTQQWAKLSKDPGFDLSGAAALGLELPHIAGAVAGGTAGALGGSGLLSIPAAMAGAAGGSAAASGLEQAALAGLDPDYRAVLHGNMNQVASGVLKDAALDSIGEGVGAPLAKVAGKVLQPAANLAGRALEGGGTLLSKAAGKVAGSDAMVAGLDFLNPIPGVGAATNAAVAAQAPSEAIRFGSKVPGWLAEHPITAPLFSEEQAAKMGLMSQALQAKGNTAESVLGGLVGGRAKNAATRYMGDTAAQATEDEAANAAMHMGKQFGITDEEALHELAAGRAKDYRQGEMGRQMSFGAEEGNWGSELGKSLDQLHAAGEGLQGAANVTTRAGLRGLQGAGIAAKLAGKAIPPAMQATRWAGLPWAVRYGLIPYTKKAYDENQDPP